MAALLFIFKACTKRYVVNSCLANPDNESVSHSATWSTNLWASWDAVMLGLIIRTKLNTFISVVRILTIFPKKWGVFKQLAELFEN